MKRRYVDELRYQRRIAVLSATRVNSICQAAGNIEAAIDMWGVRKRHLCNAVSEILGADDEAAIRLREAFDQEGYPPLANYLSHTGAKHE
ncbi:hypothetical protein QZM35_17255 [Burkholderia sp. AU45274]|uniref:hypothetical protein n=1 Tax=Burkholderia sp. AU45274 TaxID=3059205 RepID=UPI00264C2BE9|nr:hypothetical protein [Burkholderia sp. AU45274]MDN7489458.1 hypothetical protein [Burkholderia sp. AU45274]